MFIGQTNILMYDLSLCAFQAVTSRRSLNNKQFNGIYQTLYFVWSLAQILGMIFSVKLLLNHIILV